MCVCVCEGGGGGGGKTILTEFASLARKNSSKISLNIISMLIGFTLSTLGKIFSRHFEIFFFFFYFIFIYLFILFLFFI